MQELGTSKKKIKIAIISDGTGETASAVSRAIMAQFKSAVPYFTRFKNIRTDQQIESIFKQVAKNHNLILYTIVNQKLREKISLLARTYTIRTIDLLGPSLTTFSNILDQEPDLKPGSLYEINDEYFKRVRAMEYTLNHDDGKCLDTIHLADIVLIGISRTSKTPLSVYLSQLGKKVANVPLVYGSKIPEQLEEIDQRKIFALTINPETLMEIRKKRLERLKASGFQGEYADNSNVIKELEWANDLYRKNKKWVTFNITNKALEDTASEILKFLQLREKNVFLN
ncbi:MAG: bifunctional ([pyruvate, phosphate dikinase] phosphate) phosphotransferase/[pyruvate, phosphate dikinase] kinase [Halobacteriovoraceae bacterium]|nr:bifunctional ([pyruvate, phosphate dikinase] phosphate) phosphotransferase/[pyruvate, phosphate dikinase] kinase [Halobacteriovoraceae bacterium]